MQVARLAVVGGLGGVLPPLSNSWTIIIIWLYIALNSPSTQGLVFKVVVINGPTTKIRLMLGPHGGESRVQDAGLCSASQPETVPDHRQNSSLQTCDVSCTDLKQTLNSKP